MFLAWGDESASSRTQDPGAYLLGAVLVDEAHVADLRDAMRGVKRPGGSKLHWSSDDDNGHRRTLEAGLEVDIEAFVVVRVGSVDDRAERQRRKCMERFAPALEQMGCSTLTLESRGPADDRRDRACFDALRARRVLGKAGLRLEHEAGPLEPALWMADAVCGAVVASRLGDSRWLDMIQSRTSVEMLDVRLPQ